MNPASFHINSVGAMSPERADHFIDQILSDLPSNSCQNTDPGHLATHNGHFFSIWTKNNHLGIIASKPHYIIKTAVRTQDEDRERPGCLCGQYLQKSDG